MAFGRTWFHSKALKLGQPPSAMGRCQKRQPGQMPRLCPINVAFVLPVETWSNPIHTTSRQAQMELVNRGGAGSGGDRHSIFGSQNGFARHTLKSSLLIRPFRKSLTN